MDAKQENRAQWKNYPLAAAARVVNRNAEHDTDLRVTLSGVGLDFDAAEYIAEQRCLRVLQTLFPGSVAKIQRSIDASTGPMSIQEAVSDLSMLEQVAFSASFMAYLDGFTTGWLGNQYASEGIPAEEMV